MTEVPITPSPDADAAKPEVNMIRLPALTEREASTLNAIIVAGVSAIVHTTKLPFGRSIVCLFSGPIAEEFMCAAAHAQHLPCPDHQPLKARVLSKDPTFETRIELVGREIEALGKRVNEMLNPFIWEFRRKEVDAFSESEA